MCRILDELPTPLEPFDFQSEDVLIAKKNAQAGLKASSHLFVISFSAASRTFATPKRARSESQEAALSESAKRLRSSLRSSKTITAEEAGTNPEPESRKPVRSATEPKSSDIKGLLEYARRLKHEGDAERKKVTDAAKKEQTVRFF